MVGDEVVLTAADDRHDDPTLVLRASTAAATRRSPAGPLDARPSGQGHRPGSTGGSAGRTARSPEFVALLRQGHRAIDVFEALDQRGLLVELLPEWDPVRSRPQRNAYHRYTVDRHLWEAAANAAALTDRVSRPDLLVLGALFHDLGKGYPGDHTAAGMELMAGIGPRLGLPPDDVATLVRLIATPPPPAGDRLCDGTSPIRPRSGSWRTPSATRRPSSLLHTLTEADATATGPSAWGSWKAQLVAELVDEDPAAARAAGSKSASPMMMATARRSACPTKPRSPRWPPGDSTSASRATVTCACRVVCDDVPGAFARVAGVLTLRGLDVLSAWAHSAELGGPAMAASEFVVMSPPGGVDQRPSPVTCEGRWPGSWPSRPAWPSGRGRTAADGRCRRRRPVRRVVTFHDDASTTATVIEVRAPNTIGVLHRITRALADLGLDIRHATVQSLGEDVVDTFYVLGRNGRLVTDEFHRAEIRRAVLFAVS